MRWRRAPNPMPIPCTTIGPCSAVFVVATCMLLGCSAPEREIKPGTCPLPACSDWTYRHFVHEGIPIVGFRKPSRGQDHLVVYIEGDGKAWQSRSRISKDPTPGDPVALRLALRDPAPAVVYVARPCQYVGDKLGRGCDPSLWTDGRYSREVVGAMNRAITDFKLSPKQRLTLVGYSGGGVIATRVASRRLDVDDLVTVAAPLDVAAWTDYHGVSPLKDSLTRSERKAGQGTNRQLHFHGGKDLVVPPAVIEGYRRRAAGVDVHFITVPEFGHRCCWARDWPVLLSMLRQQRVQ